jgi:hypothetical protein
MMDTIKIQPEVVSPKELPRGDRVDQLLVLAKLYRELLQQNAAIDQKAKAFLPQQSTLGFSPPPAENPIWVNLRQKLIQGTPAGEKLRKKAKEYREAYEKANYHDATEELVQWLEMTEQLSELSEKITSPLTEEQVQVIEDQLAHEAHAEWQKDSGYTQRWKPIADTAFVSDLLTRLQTATEEDLQQVPFKTFRLEGGDKILDAKAMKETSLFSIDKIPDGFIPKSDIQNLPHNELPQNRKDENVRGVKAAVESIHNAIKNGEKIDLYWLERTAAEIHRKWLEQNHYVFDTQPGEKDYPLHSIQRLDYNDPQFSQQQKNKDRVQIMSILRKYVGAL